MADRTVSVRLQAEIGSYVAGMAKAAGATRTLGTTAETTAKRTKSSFDLAGKGALLLGGGVAAALVGVITKSMAFEKAMSAVAAATGKTGAELDALRDSAMRAGADTQYSAEEAAQAITEMAKAGVSAKDIMGGGLKGALNLAAAGQMDVAAAAETASIAMTQFNLRGEDLPHVADLLAAGAGKAVGSVDDLGQALNQAGLVASGTGLSIEETTGTLAAFAAQGLIGSDAGTSLKTMLQRLQNPSKQASEVMSELGINMYDANGNFVGMDVLAGQLKGSLGELTQAERDKALATIFGSDAVRAANVLYANGAEGIANWTNQVNDAGFAEKQAAALTDNLSGDLERLGGAFDTLLISVGEGTQGPLRSLVQMLEALVEGVTWAVDVWRELPGPVKAAVVSMAAVAALRGPVTGALGAIRGVAETAALKMMYLRDGMAGAVGVAGKARAGFAGVSGLLGGPWGMAITGAVVGLTSFVSWMKNAGEASEEAKSAQKEFAEVIRQSNGALDENVRKAAAKAAQDAGLLDAAEDAGISLGRVTDALMGNSDAYDEVRAALLRYEQAGVEFDSAGNAYISESADVAVEARKALDELVPTISETVQEEQQLASATETATAAVDDATAASEEYAAEAENVATQVDDAKKAVDQFKQSLDLLTGQTANAIEVESAFEEAVAAAEGAVEDLDGAVVDETGSLKLNSEAGRKAADVLLGVRDSGNRLISTLIQQGATEDEVRAKDAKLRTSFIDTARQMGVGQREAEKLADRILGVPAQRNTRISTDVAQAQRNIDALQANIAATQGKDITLRVKAAGRFVINPNGGLQEFYSGGYTGPGAKMTPAGIVHAGEYVVTKERTSKLGLSTLENLERILPGYAAGGPVVSLTHDTRPVESVMAQVASAMRNAKPAEPPRGTGGGSGGLLPHMAAARAYVQSTYGISNIGGYSYRNIAGTGTLSDHALGKAIDVMTSNYWLGWQVARDFAFGPARRKYNTENVIWQQSISTGGGPFRRMADRGSVTQNHYDHVHIDSYKTGTPFVPHDGLAYLHRGEMVVPEHLNRASREVSGSSGPRIIVQAPNSGPRRESNITVQTWDGGRAVVRALRDYERQAAALAPAW